MTLPFEHNVDTARNEKLVLFDILRMSHIFVSDDILVFLRCFQHASRADHLWRRRKERDEEMAKKVAEEAAEEVEHEEKVKDGCKHLRSSLCWSWTLVYLFLENICCTPVVLDCLHSWYEQDREIF